MTTLNQAQVQTLTAQAYEFAKDNAEVLLSEGTLDVPFTATLVLPAAIYKDTVYNVAALTGNVTIPVIPGARKGMRVTFLFLQDATGSRTITWNAAFGFTANGAGTGNQVAATSFVYTGTRWVQEGGAVAFKA